VLELSTLDHFETLPEEIERNPVAWKKFVTGEMAVPDPLATHLPDFSVIVLHKVLKPEQVTTLVKQYVERAMGQFFVKPIIHSLGSAYDESRIATPLILILTPGNDPMEGIKKFADEKKQIVYSVSLGKGQGERAKLMIQEKREYGDWVVLQNCHLATSWLPELEQIIEQLSEGPTHFAEEDRRKNFRLWLTSMSTDTFPVSILQNGIKISSEPPTGVKASLVRTFQQIDSSKAEREFFDSHGKPAEWKKLFLALSFFHAIVRDRRRYGSLGWNQRYDFNDSDFRISMRQLHLMVETFEQVPFKALQYLTGECNYGGRVTDDWDRRTLTTLLSDFYTDNTLYLEYKFVPGMDEYYILQEGEFEDYFEYVKSLPDQESPLLVGLHPNANITLALNESAAMLNDILRLSSDSEGATGHLGQQATKMANEILVQIREPFKIKEVEKKYPFKYGESMNSVLLQELARFNDLIDTVKTSLEILLKTLQGKLVMTPEIEHLMHSVLNNSVPTLWKQRSYPSRKPLLSWVKDLKERLNMLDDWILKGQPAVFWISGFYFTQSFLTGVKQNYARKHRHPIDKIGFEFRVLKYEDEVKEAPESGCYVRGLFLEGAGWNNKDGILEESQPKQLFVEMPVVSICIQY